MPRAGLFGLVAILIFTVAVFESFVYLIGNGALDWGPVKQLRNMRSMVSAERTTATTVRRVVSKAGLTMERRRDRWRSKTYSMTVSPASSTTS